MNHKDDNKNCMSDSSEEYDDWKTIHCTIGTINEVFSQIESFSLPYYFYTRKLPIPDQLLKLNNKY